MSGRLNTSLSNQLFWISAVFSHWSSCIKQGEQYSQQDKGSCQLAFFWAWITDYPASYILEVALYRRFKCDLSQGRDICMKIETGAVVGCSDRTVAFETFLLKSDQANQPSSRRCREFGGPKKAEK
ncbi:hypothetical protein J6590_039867 [Homalodisca vitripennis]|nr:hypothetical protein J6590_039867 [Homalodisca vitripennis]